MEVQNKHQYHSDSTPKESEKTKASNWNRSSEELLEHEVTMTSPELIQKAPSTGINIMPHQ